MELGAFKMAVPTSWGGPFPGCPYKQSPTISGLYSAASSPRSTLSFGNSQTIINIKVAYSQNIYSIYIGAPDFRKLPNSVQRLPGQFRDLPLAKLAKEHNQMDPRTTTVHT